MLQQTVRFKHSLHRVSNSHVGVLDVLPNALIGLQLAALGRMRPWV